MQQYHFLGVDIAGPKNTWVCELIWDQEKLILPYLPYIEGSLGKIVSLVQKHNFVACAIDAPLSFSPSSIGGWRLSDKELRRLLPSPFKNIVVSQDALTAVTSRGMQLASLLRPFLGTLIETHPRASLVFVTQTEPALNKHVKTYKGKSPKRESQRLLCDFLTSGRFIKRVCGPKIRFKTLSFAQIERHPKLDGIIDAFMCALIAFLYIYRHSLLLRLPSEPDIRGYAPFYVISPSV